MNYQLLSQQTTIGMQFRLSIQDVFTSPSNNRKATGVKLSYACLQSARTRPFTAATFSGSIVNLGVFVSMLNLSLE